MRPFAVKKKGNINDKDSLHFYICQVFDSFTPLRPYGWQI